MHPYRNSIPAPSYSPRQFFCLDADSGSGRTGTAFITSRVRRAIRLTNSYNYSRIHHQRALLFGWLSRAKLKPLNFRALCCQKGAATGSKVDKCNYGDNFLLGKKCSCVFGVGRRELRRRRDWHGAPVEAILSTTSSIHHPT